MPILLLLTLTVTENLKILTYALFWRISSNTSWKKMIVGFYWSIPYYALTSVHEKECVEMFVVFCIFFPPPLKVRWKQYYEDSLEIWNSFHFLTLCAVWGLNHSVNLWLFKTVKAKFLGILLKFHAGQLRIVYFPAFI